MTLNQVIKSARDFNKFSRNTGMSARCRLSLRFGVHYDGDPSGRVYWADAGCWYQDPAGVEEIAQYLDCEFPAAAADILSYKDYPADGLALVRASNGDAVHWAVRVSVSEIA